MKLKQSFRYQLADYKAGILVYYCAMLGLLALFLVSTVVDTGVTVVFSGLSGFSCIFLFICGLCSLHDNLPMHLQHGVSRKTMFRARLLVTVAVSAFMAAVDTLLSVLINLLGSPFYGGSLFQKLYGKIYPSLGPVGNVLLSWCSPSRCSCWPPAWGTSSSPCSTGSPSPCALPWGWPSPSCSPWARSW